MLVLQLNHHPCSSHHGSLSAAAAAAAAAAADAWQVPQGRLLPLQDRLSIGEVRDTYGAST
jgi:hypothetical protein